MKMIIFSFLCLSALYGSTQAPNNWQDTLDNWFVAGECEASIFKLRPSQQAAELKVKIRNSIQEKGNWFKEYTAGKDLSKDLPYHKNFGITESEYATYLDQKDASEFGFRGRAKLEVINDSLNTKTTFKSVGHITGINYVTVDHLTNKLSINSTKSPKAALKFKGVIQDDTKNNLYNSAFYGGSWKHTSENFGKGTGILYQIDMIRLTESDHIFITIVVQQSVDGKLNQPNVVPFSFPRTVRVKADDSAIKHGTPVKSE
jgi:hypothetical protein